VPLIRQSQPALGDKNTPPKCRQNLSARLKQVVKVTDFFGLSIPFTPGESALSQTLREPEGLYIFQPSQHCPTTRMANQ
jgi:hypothetical protein